MQLPRGTFREIKKHEKIEILLLGLEHERFSGICTLSFPAGNGVLVYRSGKCILAKVLAGYGDTGLEELQKFLDQTGDAALSLLDETQIQLALEFNKPAIVKKSGSMATGHSQESHPRHISPADAKLPPVKELPAGTETVIIRPATSRIRVVSPDHTTHPASHPNTPAHHPMKPRKNENEVDRGHAASHSRVTSFDQDMETFDNLDIEKVTDKIRGDCKTMIKQLDLEHLLER